ncbi:hypothetical protein ETB97_011056, partial [Aspergillus alliaceus]
GGEVTLNSSDPLQQANINLNSFNENLGIIAIREGIRFVYDVLKNGEGFKDIVEDVNPREMPLDDDEAMKRTVLDRSQTSFHPRFTAHLSKNIQQGVVDPSLWVHGINNLRVIDVSVIPVIPDCRIQNSVYMDAEKDADAINVAMGIFTIRLVIGFLRTAASKWSTLNYIHGRDIEGFIRDHDHLFSQALANLKPGEWFEFASTEVNSFSGHGTHKFGQNFDTVSTWKERTGFANIREDVYKFPQCPGSKTPTQKPGPYH